MGAGTTVELFTTWQNRHGDLPMAARDLDEAVRNLIDPQGRGRQYVAAQLEKLTGTRIAELVLSRPCCPRSMGSGHLRDEKRRRAGKA